jgi:hypothetical protein
MGGVNFTRNRAWWHTVIWDEYGQRHQYLAIFPTMAFMIPLYWYGSFVNRGLEQIYAAKMYQLDYENRRNRLVHNMVMEHFETHVEKVQDLLDEVKKEGFEKAFEFEIKNPTYERINNNPVPEITEEYLAELSEYTGLTAAIDDYIEYSDMPYWQRQQLEKQIFRRKTPYAPYKEISKTMTQIKGPNGVFDVDLDPYDAEFSHKKQISASEDS